MPLTAVPGTWDSGVTFTYQWTVDGTNVTVKVTGTRNGYGSVTKQSAPTAPVADGDLALTPTPTITGTPEVGQLLTAVTGTWDSGVTFTYQWRVDGADVAGATGSTYTPVAGDVGEGVTVRVTGAKSGFTSATKESAPTGPVTGGVLPTAPKPTITGTPKVATPLTAVTGTWEPGATLTYQWTVAGTDVGGATTSTYTPVVGDLGKAVTVKVTGAKAGYTSVTKESDPTAAVAAGDLPTTSAPTIGGVAKYGNTLISAAGSWATGTTFAYQWLVDGSPVAGANGVGYVVRTGDVGKTVTVAVTGSKTGYASITRTSAPTAAVAAASLGDNECTVSLSGKPKVGKKLTAAIAACPAGATVSYSWYAANKQLNGADGATYKLKKAQAGDRIKVSVTVTVPGYESVTRVSGQTAKVKSNK